MSQGHTESRMVYNSSTYKAVTIESKVNLYIYPN